MAKTMNDTLTEAEEKEREEKIVKKKKFYVLFLIMGLSLLIVISSVIVEPLIRVLGQLILLILQYVVLDGILTDYFAG
jgi:hypothetical protein